MAQQTHLDALRDAKAEVAAVQKQVTATEDRLALLRLGLDRARAIENLRQHELDESSLATVGQKQPAQADVVGKPPGGRQKTATLTQEDAAVLDSVGFVEGHG